MQKLKIKDLEFGVNVFKGDLIPVKRFSDILNVINNEDGLDNVKNTLDGDLAIIIDRANKNHNKHFIIPSFSESRKEYTEMKGDKIKQFKIN